jgi:hypothetical protein
VVVPTVEGVRLIVGYVAGKGLAAVDQAATVMTAFRATACRQFTLAAVADWIEEPRLTSLARRRHAGNRLHDDMVLLLIELTAPELRPG